MKKKMYRIELKEIDTIFTDMVLMAAAANGGDYKPLNKIADAADWLCQRYPTTGECHTVNRIGNYALSIDKGTKNILLITEIEVMELDMPEITTQEAKDLLDEINPVLNRQGINNPDHHENLN